MQLIRKVHPVGCGAFITEVFEWKGGGFTAVYDCGMGRSVNTPKALKTVVDNAFMASQVIGLLFLSHFDNDHINGVSYLISTGHITQNTKVVLPLVKERYFALLSDEYQKGYISVIKSLKGKRGELLLVKEVGPDENNKDSDDKEADDLIPGYVQNIDGEKIRIVESRRAIPVVLDDGTTNIWEYYPFYLQDESLIELFKQYVIKKAQRDKCALSENDLGHYQNLTNEQRSLIRKAYHSFKRGGTYKGGPNRINMNSMLLISTPKDVPVGSSVIVTPAQSYNKVAPIEQFPSSSVYTADVGLRERFYMDLLKTNVDDHSLDAIGLFQIPHHGSYRNYTKDIYTELKPNVLFINGSLNSSCPAICPESINDSYINNKPLYIIDDNSATQFEQHIMLVK